MSHHKVNPPHGEDGHVCPREQHLSVEIPVQDILDIVLGVELAIEESAKDVITMWLEGDIEDAQRAAVANLTWLRVHGGLVDILQQFMHQFQEDHGVEEEAKTEKRRPGIPEAILRAFQEAES